MNRERAMEELKARLTNKNLIKHSLAVEAIMRELAVHFKDDVEVWGLTGLLHDIDYDRTFDNPMQHGMLGAEILENLGVDEEIAYAVRAHNDLLGIERKRKLDKALYFADPVSGLITASALILPSKKLLDVTVEFVMRKLDEKAFAKGANREAMRKCEEAGLPLEELIGLSLKAMQGISGELEL